MKIFATIAIGLLIATTCFAQPKTREQKVGFMSAIANQSASMAKLEELAGDWIKAADTRRDGLAKLEEYLPVALSAAKGKPDVVQALKAYYLAAKAYLGSSIPSDVLERAATMRLKADMEAKSNALDLEIKLAGLEIK
jgi:hypothetical protein